MNNAELNNAEMITEPSPDHIAFYHGIPAPSMRRSYNGRGYLGNYYQPGKRY